MAKKTFSHFVEFSKPFIDAAKNIFEVMIFSTLETGRPVLKKDSVMNGDISSIIGISGKYKNQKEGKSHPYKAILIISWPFDTYLNVASAMLMEEFTEYCDDNADVGAEITNMIMGNAKRDLALKGYQSDMSIPSIVSGKRHTIHYPKNTKIIEIPAHCNHGNVYFEIGYSEK